MESNVGNTKLARMSPGLGAFGATDMVVDKV
jgi:hypothetical protein